jgi:Cu(I)/Ag(I) efflux system membrane protein CusA/SilA
MSLAGIVVSIGVLIDSTIVIAENVTHQLHREFGDRPVSGDVSEIVAKACSTVGVPAFCAVLIMIISFLPVFALEGIDGRMYRPLAWTKTLALLSAAILTVTLVPVLCTVLIRGRVRAESESALVRTIVGVYRPVLTYLMDQPSPLIVLLCVTMIVSAAATGIDLAVRLATVISIGLVCWCISRVWARVWLTAMLILVAFVSQSTMRPIGLALRLPLDEGMIMDMPITVPRVTISQAVDDLKARNMVLCRFPEVQMVAGKAGRAETPFDPAPLDMIETMVEFRSKVWWPNRRLLASDAKRQTAKIVSALSQAGLVDVAPNPSALVGEIVEAGLVHFDAVTREVCWQRLQLFQSELSRDLVNKLTAEIVNRLSLAGGLARRLTDPEIRSVALELSPADVRRLGQLPDAASIHMLVGEIQKCLYQRGWLKSDSINRDRLLSASTSCANAIRQVFGIETLSLEEDLLDRLQTEFARRWSEHQATLNAELRSRAAGTWTRIVCSELLLRQPILDDALFAVWNQVLTARYGAGKSVAYHGDQHAGMPSHSPLPIIDPHPVFDALVDRLTQEFSKNIWLWPHDSESLCRNSGEMDRAVQMPGWANVWTRPIQNRVDMLATGVNSEVGVRVLGRNLDDVVQASEDLAVVLREIQGAADVVSDPIRGKGYVDVIPDAIQLAREGVALADVEKLVSISTNGRVVSRIDDGMTMRAIRVKLSDSSSEATDALLALPIPIRQGSGGGEIKRIQVGATLQTVPLARVANIRIGDGPATIKSENGWLRNYVRLNVRERSPAEFVAAAQQRVKQTLVLPSGVFLEWTGQFEHANRTRRTMLWMVPMVLLLILAILYATFRELADAALMILVVPCALSGGVLCQWLLGFPFSIAVGVGYIACFGMAAATSMVMLVYLREAEAQAGGLDRISLAELRAVVISGAVHRLRPKLLTETATILSLAPMLWSTGVGADVVRPMAAPVLGGLLIADEVVDLLLPVAFFAVRRYRWKLLQKTRSVEFMKDSTQ